MKLKKYLTLLTLSTLSIILYAGRCDDVPDHKGRFKFTVKGASQWLIACDNECKECYGSPINGTFKFLPKSEYSDVYDKCDGLPVKPSGGGGGGGEEDNPILDIVKFSPESTNIYGFDHWRYDEKNSKKVSYMSMKIGSFNKFILAIKLKDNPFSKYVLKIENESSVDLSFDNNGTKSLKSLTFIGTVEDEEITVYEKRNFVAGTAEINLYGIDDDNKETLITGSNSSFPEDQLKVIVYEEKIITNSQQKVYLVNTPAITKDASQWKMKISEITKQAVVKYDADSIVEVTNSKWDLNSNGYLDVASEGNLPSDKDEFSDLLIQIGEEEDECIDNLSGATIIVKGGIRVHTFLIEDAVEGATVLSVNHVPESGFEIGEDIYIGPWLWSEGANDNYEWVEIIDYDDLANLLTIKGSGVNSGLENYHAKDESYWSDDEVLGFTIGSCSCMGDNVTFETITHEMLHQVILGELEHVNDVTNLMYPFYDSTRNILRYRELTLNKDDRDSQQQWKILQEAIN